MVIVLMLAGVGSLCAVGGYVARGFVENYRQDRRERALAALSGELPGWEKRARALEVRADEDEIEGFPVSASRKRDEADRIRRVSRRRIRKDRDWCP